MDWKERWLMQQFKEIEGACERSIGPGIRQARESRRHQPWTPPERGWIKVNTDGCVKQTTGRASCGGIVRDEDANFVGAFTLPARNCGVLEAELWGIYHGLKKSWEMGYRKVIMESDSISAVRNVNGNETTGGPCKNLVHKCRTLMRQHWEIVIHHVPREQNQVANALAQTTSNHQEGVRHHIHPL